MSTPPAYGYQGSTGSGAPVPAKTNTLSIITLVLAILGFTLIPIVLGFVSLSQIKKTGEAGRGLAIAGIIVSFVYIVIIAIIVIFTIVISVAAANSGVSTY